MRNPDSWIEALFQSGSDCPDAPPPGGLWEPVHDEADEPEYEIGDAWS